MGIYDDIMASISEDLYENDSPLLDRFSSGEKPMPVEELFKDLGVEKKAFQPEQPKRVELDPWKILTTSEEWTPDHNARLKELMGAHTKDAGRSTALGILSTSEYLNRMKKKYIPYYKESTAVKALSDAITKFGPGVMALDENHEQALSMLAESEYLKADPRALETSNWFEDVLSVGPQMGSMVLASMAGGPWAGFGMIGMQILGSSYDNMVQNGADPHNAYYWALGNAVTQGALEMVPFLKAMNKFKFRMPLLERLKVLGEVAGTELFTEWAQSYPDSFTNIFATNPDKKLLERAELFVDDLWETTKQGAYEGTLTAPWSLLMAPFGGIAGHIKRSRNKEEEGSQTNRRLAEDENVQDQADRAAPEGEFVPSADEDIISRRAPSRAASSVTQAHLDMMTKEQQAAYRQVAFKDRFAQMYEAMVIEPEEAEGRKQNALKVADQFASTLRIVGNDVFTRQPDLEDIQKERILQDMGLVQTQDQYSGALNQLGIIRGDGIPDRPVFDKKEQFALTREEYNRRANLLGTLSDFYSVDTNQIPPDLRGAYSLMAEQVAGSEPKGVTFIDQKGDVNLAEGTAYGYGSSYPGWFKEPFSIRYLDSRIKKDKDGKTVTEPVKDKDGNPVLYTKGPNKGKQKMEPVRELQENKEDFKFGLNRNDFFGLIEKLDGGKLLTARQSAISDHIMGIAQQMKSSDPELFMQGEIDQLESEGYEIVGNAIQLGSLDLGDQVAIENEGYNWDNYTVVSEDDGAGNMVLDSLNDRIQAPPTEEINAVAVKPNNYWKTMYDVGGPQAVSDAPRTLPGIKDIEPLHNLVNEYSETQMEEDFADNYPELAEFFENPEGIRIKDKEDRRQSETPVEEDKRSGKERRENFMMTAQVDKMTPAERDEALTYARKIATTDVLTGLFNNTAFEMHKKEFGEDVPFIAIDVDGLKYYNDMTQGGLLPTGEIVEGGHKLGNQVLALMGRAMTEAAETTGIADRVKLFRFGGDEYGVTGIDRDTVSQKDLEIFERAIHESASQIVIDLLGRNDNIHYQLNGLAFTSATGGTIDNAISASEKIKDGLDNEYATITEKGKEKPTRARIPGTRVEVNYLPVKWSQGSTGLLASQARANEKVGRDLSQTEPAAIDETVVGVGLSGPEWRWHADDTVEDAVAWTDGHIRRLAESDALPEKDAWNFILGELLNEAEDIGMPPYMLASGVDSGGLQLAQEYLSNEQLGVTEEAAVKKALPAPKLQKVIEAAPPWEMTDAEREVARKDLENAPSDVRIGINESAAGVIIGAQTRMDWSVDKKMQEEGIWPKGQEVYDAFNASREMMRKRHGDTIKLYRLQGDETIENKHTLNWATRDELKKYQKFSEWADRKLISKEVPIDDILAINVGKSGKYQEFIVLNRKSKGRISLEGEPSLIASKVPQLPAPPPKLMAPEVALAEALPSPEEAPTVKSRKAKFVRDNIEYLPMSETVTVQYMDPKTGEIFESEETAAEAFTDLDESINKFYELMECLKA